MHKLKICPLVFFFILTHMFSQEYNYNNGNGTEFDSGNTEKYEWTLRKHIQHNIVIGDLARDPERVVYRTHNIDINNIIGNIQDDDVISTTEIYFKKFGDRNKNQTWLKIKIKEIEGWIIYSRTDPFICGMMK